MARKRLIVSEKLNIIADANARMATGESLKSVCRSYNIQPNQLRDWKRNVDALSSARKNKKSLFDGGIKGRLHAHEDAINGWVLEMKERGVPLTYKHIIVKAVQVDPTFGQLAFQAQYHAVRRWCIRNCVGICRATRTSQRHPQEIEIVDQAL